MANCCVWLASQSMSRQVAGYVLFFCKSKQHKVLETGNFPNWAACRSQWTTKALLLVREEKEEGGVGGNEGEKTSERVRDENRQHLCLCMCGCGCVYGWSPSLILAPISGHNRGVWCSKARGNVHFTQRLVGAELRSKVIIWIVLAIWERPLYRWLRSCSVASKPVTPNPLCIPSLIWLLA